MTWTSKSGYTWNQTASIWFYISNYKVFSNLSSFHPQIVFNICHSPICLHSTTPFNEQPSYASVKTLVILFYRCIDARNYLPADLCHAQSLSVLKKVLAALMSSFFKGSVNLWLDEPFIGRVVSVALAIPRRCSIDFRHVIYVLTVLCACFFN